MSKMNLFQVRQRVWRKKQARLSCPHSYRWTGEKSLPLLLTQFLTFFPISSLSSAILPDVRERSRIKLIYDVTFGVTLVSSTTKLKPGSSKISFFSLADRRATLQMQEPDMLKRIHEEKRVNRPRKPMPSHFTAKHTNAISVSNDVTKQ